MRTPAAAPLDRPLHYCQIENIRGNRYWMRLQAESVQALHRAPARKTPDEPPGTMEAGVR